MLYCYFTTAATSSHSAAATTTATTTYTAAAAEMLLVFVLLILCLLFCHMKFNFVKERGFNFIYFLICLLIYSDAAINRDPVINRAFQGINRALQNAINRAPKRCSLGKKIAQNEVAKVIKE